jgi:hypothetical protein
MWKVFCGEGTSKAYPTLYYYERERSYNKRSYNIKLYILWVDENFDHALFGH